MSKKERKPQEEWWKEKNASQVLEVIVIPHLKALEKTIPRNERIQSAQERSKQTLDETARHIREITQHDTFLTIYYALGWIHTQLLPQECQALFATGAIAGIHNASDFILSVPKTWY